MSFFIESAIFFFSSALTIALNYYQIPPKTLQQIIVLLLIVILISFSRVSFLNKGFQENKIDGIRLMMILLSSLFIQLLVVSTGGFYSPFLILLHLFVIGTGFLLNVKSSITFLIFSLAVLISHIIINPNMQQIFQNDPWSLVLYAISFIVIIPLVGVVTRNYHLKEALSDMLSEYIQIEQQRQESILQGLTELVLVTDKNLKILSINSAAEKTLRISNADIIKRHLLDVLDLRDENGNQATISSLSLPQALSDKASRIVEGFSLTVSGKPKPIKVVIQVRPIFDLQNRVSQIVFVLSDAAFTPSKTVHHIVLEQAKAKKEEQLTMLRNLLIDKQLSTLQIHLEILAHINDDLLTVLEVEDHPIKEVITFEDLAYLGKQIVDKKLDFAKAFGVSVEFYLPKEDIAERAILGLQNSDLPPSLIPPSSFSVPVDVVWLGLCIQKVLEMAVLLSADKGNNPKVTLSVKKEDSSAFIIKIQTSYPKIPNSNETDLLREYYGNFDKKSSLHTFGSGLEGYIAKKIADQINTPIVIRYEGYPSTLAFLLYISREAR